WVTELSQRDGVTVNRIEWTLTERTRDTVTAEVRRAAVADAIDKATAYAEAAGFARVHPVAISDPGLLQGTGDGSPAPQASAYSDRDGATRGAAEPGVVDDNPEVMTSMA